MASSSGDSPVRILHLSDIHFRAGKAWDSDPVLRHLARFIGSEVRQGMTPDLVVITGDLAYSGKAEEYRKDGERKPDERPCTAQEWLEDELWPALSPDAANPLPRDRLLLLPVEDPGVLLDVDRPADLRARTEGSGGPVAWG